MRDPQRISEVMPLLQSVWEQCPDLRLGQLLCALSYLANNTADPFYMEEEDLLIGIQKFHEARLRDASEPL